MGRPAVWRSLAALLRLGLHRFWQQALPIDGGLPGLLLQEAAELLPETPAADWAALKARLEQSWPPEGETLARLIADFELDLPEALLLTLLGEVERSHLISLVVAELQAPAAQPRPTVHLAAALLDALFGSGTVPILRLPELPWFQSRLVELDGDGPLPLRSLRMAPAIWSVLLEQAGGWPRCSPIPAGDPELLPEAVSAQLPMLADLLQSGGARGIVLRGHPHSGRRQAAAILAEVMGCRALAVPVEAWQQEPALAVACRYARWLPVLEPRLGPGEVWRTEIPPEGVPLLVVLGTDGAVEGGRLLELALPVPDEPQRRNLWARFLGDEVAVPAEIASALLSGPSLASLAANARLLARRDGEPLALCHIVHARRHLGAERLRLLAQPVEREVDASALVLPPLVAEELDGLVTRAARRESLWQGLGATLRQTVCPGLRALFVGESGTGKTLAASYIATRLGAPLYRVDLSAVMNKYIGESEKNLSALLDMAAAGDVVLLFDEADSLFGRRTEGKETGERYANMLTHFLLTRIENHPGIVLLTSNNRERIDAAFTRRLDLIVEFPQPGFEERLELWRSHLGERGPGEAVYRLLASYCNFVGGQLRNVVLAAAAAGDGAITSEHLLVGLLAEYRKLGREMPAKLGQIRAL